MDIDAFWLFNLAISIPTLPMVWRLYRLRRKINPIGLFEFLKILGACFVPMLNIGMLMKSYLEPKERLWVVTGVALKACDDLDRWLKEKDESGELLMAMMMPDPAVYYKVPDELFSKLRYNEIEMEFWRYMGMRCKRLGYDSIHYQQRKNGYNNQYLKIFIGG